MENHVIIEPETRRLKLRQWQKKDYLPFAKMNADADLMKYFPSTLNKQESDAMADKIRTLIKTQGWGFWAVEIKEKGEFIGFTGLHKPQDNLPFLPCVEIGWRLAKEHWGKGYATEAAKAALEVAFYKLHIEQLYAFTAIQNNRSQAVMQRLYMINTNKNFEHPKVPKKSGLKEHVLYKLTKKRWKEQSGIEKNH